MLVLYIVVRRPVVLPHETVNKPTARKRDYDIMLNVYTRFESRARDNRRYTCLRTASKSFVRFCFFFTRCSRPPIHG